MVLGGRGHGESEARAKWVWLREANGTGPCGDGAAPDLDCVSQYLGCYILRHMLYCILSCKVLSLGETG